VLRTVHSGVNEIKEYYRDPRARIALVVTAVLLCYGGGAVMFYVHAIVFNEGGPAISPYLHWALDSTFGFVALAPIIALLLPLTAWLTRNLPEWTFPLALGAMFTIVTIPGPLAHDLVVARGTPIARVVTHHFGDPAAMLPPPADYSAIDKMLHQFAGGLPAYLVLSTVAFLLVRRAVRR
jgi:hypothetical protein